MWYAKVCGYKFQNCDFGKFNHTSKDIYYGSSFVARTYNQYPIDLMKSLFIRKFIVENLNECMYHVVTNILEYPRIVEYKYQNYCNERKKQL